MGRSKGKKRREFSQWHVIFADALVACVFAASVVLSFFDKMPVSDVAIAIISCYGAFATGGYFAQNCVRSTSLNKMETALGIANADNQGGADA